VASEQGYGLAALLAQSDAIGNLLAVILGDGGHRQAEVGTAQAAAEALERVQALHQREVERPRASDLDAVHKHVARERAATVRHLRALGVREHAALFAADEIERGEHHVDDE